MKTITISLIFLLAVLSTSAQQAIHVSPTATGTGNGSNWANASTLENAVSVATATSVLWLKTGTYNLSATLVIPQGVRVYGGFTGTETALSQRNFATNPTIIDANQQFAAVHLGVLSVLSGVTVQNGVANTTARSSGGGVFMSAGSRIEYSYILNNLALKYGGGVYAEANAEIFNSVIAHNRAGISGFAVAGDEIIFRSNTVTENALFDCNMFLNEPSFDTVCSGQTIELFAGASGRYLWSTGATTSSITTPPLTASTTFTVSVTTPDFCVATDTFHIAVNPTPVVTIAVDPTSANPADMVTFTATATPPGGTFLWNDIGATTAATLTAQMPDVGDLQFTVTYELNECHAIPVTATATNTDFVPPVIDGATFTADDMSICLADSTQLRLTGGTRNSGEWVLYSGACGGSTATEMARTDINNPTFWVRPTATTTFFIRGEGGGTETTCMQVQVTVLPLPMATTAPDDKVCIGQNLVLSNPTTGGGDWSINPITSTGRISFAQTTESPVAITGISAGDVTVIFTAANGCQAFFNLEVLTAPTPIVGDTNFCQGASHVLTSTPIGGIWSTAGGNSATVNAAGLVTAEATRTGATTIQYTHPTTGCVVSQVVVVHQQPTRPSAVANQVCVGDFVTLNPGIPTGGTWSIATPHIAELNTELNRITGRVAGNAIVRYQLNEHCSDTFHITVLPPVRDLSYAFELCQGGHSTATGMPTGGTWTSTNLSIASVDENSGVFTGISTGTFSLVYTLANGCSRTSTPIAIHLTPTEITGYSAVGVGLTTQLLSSPDDGIWTSLNPATATVDATGLVAGVSPGSTTIRYTLATGSCHRDFSIRVDACASLILVAERMPSYEVCLNVPITKNIQYLLTHATTTEILWTNHEGVSIPQPEGITFDPTTHTINGMPTQSGVFKYTIKSKDHAEVCPAAEASGILTVFDVVSAGTIGSVQGQDTILNICFGDVVDEFVSTAEANGGNPAVASYQWQISTDNIVFSDISGATSPNFQAAVLTETRYFRRIFNNICAAGGAVASNVITVNVHAFPSVPTAENIVPNTDCSGISPNGAITIAAAANMNYSIDGTTFGSDRTFSNLTHGQHTIFIRNANNCKNSANVYVPSESGAPELIAMTVTPSTTICNPFIGENLVIAPEFDYLGTDPTFRWSIVDGSNVTDISGATSQTLTLTTAPSATTTYRITVTNTVTDCHAHFDKTIIVVTPPTISRQPVGGSICIGQQAITLSVLSNRDHLYTYKWQKSIDNMDANFTDISGATSSTYTMPNNVASNYWYRLQIVRTDGVCPPVSSDAVQVNVLAPPTIASVTGGYRCAAGAVAISATTNPGTASVRWFANQTGGLPLTTGTPSNGTTASDADWTTPSIAATTIFWAEADNGVCLSELRVAVTATVRPEHVITRTGGSANQSVCQGALVASINFAFSGGATGGTIAWSGVSESAPEGIFATATSISGVVAANATPGIYNFTITSTPSGGTCDPVQYSGSITVNVTPALVTVTAESLCESTVLTASGGEGGTIYWQNMTSNGTDLRASTSETVATNGIYFFRARSAEGCWGTQGSSTVTIIQPHTLRLISAASTVNQNAVLDIGITPITYEFGGSATEVTLTWTGTANANTPPAGISVSSLTATPITISGAPRITGTFGYTITTVANTCPSVSQTGTITATVQITGCNGNALAFTLGTPYFATSQTWIIPGTEGRPGQEWSDAVRAPGCNKTSFSGGGSNNFSADCRNATNGFNGHYFSWCMVMRFADQLCPTPWRVPTAEDFAILHQNLGHPMPTTVGGSVPIIANTYMGSTGTGSSAVNHGGLWGGTRFTAWSDGRTVARSGYWSSIEHSATGALYLRFDANVVFPHYISTSKNRGFGLRCVRD